MKEKIKDKLYVLPIVLIGAVVPLIVRYKRLELGEVAASYWVSDYNTDFFSYYKMVFFLGFTFLALISFYIYYKKENNLKKSFYYYPIAVYMLMIILSTVFSKAQLTSLTGFPDRYEGMPVLLSYLLIVLITINLFNTKEQFQFMINALLTSAVIIAVIGLFQFFEMDLMGTIFGQRLMLPQENFEAISQGLDFRFEGNNILFSTLYNPNYAGSYFSMLFVLSSVLYFFEEKLTKKVVLGAVTAVLFAAWLGSMSRAGILGALFAFLILAIVLNKEILRRYKSVVVIVVVFLAVFTFMDFYTEGSLRKEFLSMGEETQLALQGETAEIEEIKNEDGALVFDTAEEKLRFRFDDLGRLKVYDEKGKILELIELDTHLIFADQKYNNYIFRVRDNEQDDNKVFEFRYGNKKAQFLYNADINGFFILGMNNNIYPLEEVESYGFEGKEMLASKRGYIWSRTIPLLDDALLTGYGPDTFAMFFPQEDALGKLRYYNTAKKIVDKPHNIYLQFWVNTGLLSLTAVVILFAVYFLRNFKYYLKINFNDYFSRIGLGLFAAFTAYAAAGFFNDSVISVAPVFWLILGLGAAVEFNRYNNIEH
ncbi:MAG: O-antigen ligase family protein [Halanaerobium sp.]